MTKITKNKTKKASEMVFFDGGPVLYPPPLLVVGPLVEERFFAASLRPEALYKKKCFVNSPFTLNF